MDYINDCDYIHLINEAVNEGNTFTTEPSVGPFSVPALQAPTDTIISTPPVPESNVSALPQTEPFTCAKVASSVHTCNSTDTIKIEHDLRIEIFMAQRNFRAPHNMISLIQHQFLSVHQSRQFITLLKEQHSRTRSTSDLEMILPPTSSSLPPQGIGTSFNSPIDLTSSPIATSDPPMIDLTSDEISPATIAAASAILREEPSPDLQNPTGLQARLPSSVPPTAPSSPAVSNADGSFKPTGMRRLSE